LGCDGLESRQQVRLIDKVTKQAPTHYTSTPRNTIPETVVFSDEDRRTGHWYNTTSLRFRTGRQLMHYDLFYAIAGQRPHNLWVWHRIRSTEVWRFEEAVFRGDVWVSRVDHESQLCWQDISHKSADDLDYFDFLIEDEDTASGKDEDAASGEDEDAASGKDGDTATIEIEDEWFWNERKGAIKTHLVEHLRKESDMVRKDRAEVAILDL
jgi:hypothetical protein